MGVLSDKEILWIIGHEDALIEDEPIVFSKTVLNVAAAVTGIIMVAGIIGNALTILAFCKTQRANNVTTVFIVCLCAADLLFCMTVLPFNLVRFTGGAGSLREEGLACKLLPFLQYGNVGVSLLFIAMITINRYIMITHYAVYKKIYRTPFIVAMILFCWIFSFGMQIPTLLGKWGTYAYDSRLQSCTIMPDANGRSAKSALFFVGFVIPCLVIIFCYTRIYMVVRRSDTRMRRHAATNTKLSRKGKEQKEVKLKRNEWRITKMVLTIFLSFLVCYLPITIIKIADSKIQYPSYHILTYLLLYLSACINPIIYVIMNKQYRQAYKALLTCHKMPQMLSLQGRNTSLAESKNTLITNWTIERTPNRFRQIIPWTGRQYKSFHPSTLDVGHKIHHSIAKGMHQEEHLDQPEIIEKQAATVTPIAKKPLNNRILAGFDVDDEELKSIKNKLLTDAPTTKREREILRFILAQDNIITRKEFQELCRRLREDLLLMYRADLYYAKSEIEVIEQGAAKNARRCEPRLGDSSNFKLMDRNTRKEHGCSPENKTEISSTGLNTQRSHEIMDANEMLQHNPNGRDCTGSGERKGALKSEISVFHQRSRLDADKRACLLPEALCDELPDDPSWEKFENDCPFSSEFPEATDFVDFGSFCGDLEEVKDIDKRKMRHLQPEKRLNSTIDWECLGLYHAMYLNPKYVYNQSYIKNQGQEPSYWIDIGDYYGDIEYFQEDGEWRPRDWQSSGDNHQSHNVDLQLAMTEDFCDWQGFGDPSSSEEETPEDESDLNGPLDFKNCENHRAIQGDVHLLKAYNQDVKDNNTEILRSTGERPLHGHSIPAVVPIHRPCRPTYLSSSESSVLHPKEREPIYNLDDAKKNGEEIGNGMRKESTHHSEGFASHKSCDPCFLSSYQSSDAKNTGRSMEEREQEEPKSDEPLAGAGVLELMEKPTIAQEFPSEDLNAMIHALMFKFQALPRTKPIEVDGFLRFCAKSMSPRICQEMEKETRNQGETSLWFKLKFGRITASNLYAVANCRTPSGYLTKSIVGLNSWFSGNEATMRGHRLEEQVKELVEKKMKMSFKKCGLFLSGAYPILGASPDGINDTHVLEIKSPFSEKSYKDYLDKDSKVKKRYLAQIQLQMYMTGRKKGLFCVSAPDFETSRRVEIIPVEFDKDFTEDLVERATRFWKANVFPLLTAIKGGSQGGDAEALNIRPLSC